MERRAGSAQPAPCSHQGCNSWDTRVTWKAAQTPEPSPCELPVPTCLAEAHTRPENQGICTLSRAQGTLPPTGGQRTAKSLDKCVTNTHLSQTWDGSELTRKASL